MALLTELHRSRLALLLLCCISGALGRDLTIGGRAYIQSTSRWLPLYPVPRLPSVKEPSEPRNIHLSFGDTERDIVVTWSTVSKVSLPLARFRACSAPPHQPWQLATARSTKFVDGGPLKSAQWIHRAKLLNLSSGERYNYSVSSDGSVWYPAMEFRVPNVSQAQRSFAVFGDFGLANAQSLPRLLDDVTRQRMYDAIVHVGDFAYDMPDENGAVGDRFMQMLQPIASRVPYMTCVGNHEEKYNFSHYRNRFSMPGSSENFFYSVNIGPVHLVSISNEFYFFTNYGTAQLGRQYRWLDADLREANLNRTAAPWIVLIGHRPLYCSNNDSRDCDWGARTLRSGFNGHRWGLEPLIHKYGVDLAFWGHEHSYERTWPVHNGSVVGKTSDTKTYTNPRATVHVITGSAGNKEKHAYFVDKAPKFSVFRSTDYGYTRVTFFNASHALLEQVSDDKQGQVIDSFTVVQKRHGPFGWN
ncbi:hypothetical protein BOX15_Mlig011833g1 [Macrostomum lignano]|uniref:Purple acid phosphatase n=2 Tax=Macrostomum lignano TaxID=282301 RepID=A0A1I8JCV1_9PLAT|nr:hypothetical protein BOX15_Mlig011833g1 [Macrostomum lignano]